MGLSLSDWIGLASLIATVVGIPLALIGAHFHSAVRKGDARARIIQRLSRTRWRDLYHALLLGVLNWLDQKIDAPPFARSNSHGRRSWGVEALGVCISLSLAYSISSYLAGWVAGGPSTLGQLTLMQRWSIAGRPEWVGRLLFLFAMFALCAFYWWYVTAADRWSERTADRLTERLGWRGRHGWRAAGAKAFHASVDAGARAAALGLAVVIGIVVVTAIVLLGSVEGAEAPALALGLGVAIISAAAVALVIAGAQAAVAVAGPLVGAITGAIIGASAGALAGAADVRLPWFLFMFALPYLNGLLDWVSLSVSRWFGRGIVTASASPAAGSIALLLVLADLVAAVVFAFAVAWLLAFGVEVSAGWLGLSLDLETYVSQAAEAPWTTGLWATFMVLSTLVPTAIHFVLAVGAVLLAWSRNPLNRLAARRLASGNEADYLFPQLYLTFGWLVPTLAVPVALIWGLAQLTELFALMLGPVETLPYLLRDTALHAIDTARAILG